MKRILLTILLLLCVLQLLTSAITAQYTPNPTLHFVTGNTINTPAAPTGTFVKSQLVGHVGTLTITAVGEQLRRPILKGIGTSNNPMFTGPFDAWGKDRIVETEFVFWMKTSISNTAKKIWLGDNDGVDVNGWSNVPINQNPVIIDIFLISAWDSKEYHPDAEYTLTTGSIGSFNIEVMDSSGAKKYISVNGQTIPPGGGKPNTSTSIIVGGATQPEIIYGDPPQPLHYEIEVISSGVLNPSQAYGSNKATIGNARLTITNGKPSTTYQVQISFTSTKEDGSFALRSGNNGSSYSIPYTLLFGTQEVQPGTLYPWTPLQNGQNTRALQITEIIQSTVQAAPSGQFEDTIRVEVVTPD